MWETTLTAQKVSVFGVFLVGIRENTDQKNYEHGHFSRSVLYTIFIINNQAPFH